MKEFTGVPRTTKGQFSRIEKLVQEQRNFLLSQQSRESFIEGLNNLHTSILNLNPNIEEIKIANALKELINISHKILFKNEGGKTVLDEDQTQPTALHNLPDYLKDLVLIGLSRYPEGRNNETPPLGGRPVLVPAVETIASIPPTVERAEPENFPTYNLKSYLENRKNNTPKDEELSRFFIKFLSGNNLGYLYSYFSDFPEISETIKQLILVLRNTNLTSSEIDTFDCSKLEIPEPLAKLIDRDYLISQLKTLATKEWAISHSPEKNYFSNKEMVRKWIDTFNSAKNPEQILLSMTSLRNEFWLNNADTSDLDIMMSKFLNIRETVENQQGTIFLSDDFPHSLGLERIYKKMYHDITDSNLKLRRSLGITPESLREINSRIYKTQTFKELVSEIQKIKHIIGVDGRLINKDVLIDSIIRFSSGDKIFYSDNILKLTRFAGIRIKVQDLWDNNFVPRTKQRINNSVDLGSHDITQPLPVERGSSITFDLDGDTQQIPDYYVNDATHRNPEPQSMNGVKGALFSLRNSEPFKAVESFFERIGLLKKD